MNIRLSKVSSQMVREISTILTQDISDPRMRGFLTVSHVEPAADLKTAKVYYSVLGSDVDINLTQTVINASRGHIQKLLARRLQMRSTPVLNFIYDDGSRLAAKISEISAAEDEPIEDLIIDDDAT